MISGNLHRNKGQDIALKASHILLDKGISDFELWIAGQASAMKDSQIFEKELKEFASNKLGDNCKFLGFISDMKRLRQQADIELVCSNKEGFGRMTVKAMMSGNPVIATDSGANPELVNDKKSGRLFVNKNAKDLAEKMEWFIEDKTRIAECGANAYEFVKDNFLSIMNTKNIESIYGKIAK